MVLVRMSSVVEQFLYCMGMSGKHQGMVMAIKSFHLLAGVHGSLLFLKWQTRSARILSIHLLWGLVVWSTDLLSLLWISRCTACIMDWWCRFYVFLCWCSGFPDKYPSKGVLRGNFCFSSLNVIFSCTCALVQYDPINIIVGQFSFGANHFSRCCNPGMDATVSLEGTTSTALGKRLYM